MTAKFSTPIILDKSTDDEQKYRYSLAKFLNEGWSQNYLQAGLLDQSNSNVVYSVVDASSKKQVLKFFRDENKLQTEVAALTYWHEKGALVPKVYTAGSIAFREFQAFYVEMEFIKGENLLTSLERNKVSLDREHREQMANLLKSISMPYDGKKEIFNIQKFDEPEVQQSIEKFLKYNAKISKAYDTYLRWINTQETTFLVHGDFREGNCINAAKGVYLIDPGPCLGHPYIDFAYYLILSYMHGYTNYLNAFVDEFFKEQVIHEDLLWAISVLEGLRMYGSWGKNRNSISRELYSLLETMLEKNIHVATLCAEIK
jgi:Ser/Thr protein kinase RdoA (MazF antagonist)